MGVLAELAQRLVGETDDDLRREVAGLQLELREFRRAHRDFAENAHEGIAQAVATIRAEVDRALLNGVGALPGAVAQGAGTWMATLLECARLKAVIDDELIAAAHNAVDAAQAAGAFSPLSLAEFNERVGAFEAQIRDRQFELERRRVAGEADERAAALEALEARAAG